MTQNDSNRRAFLKTSTAAAAGAALTSTIAKKPDMMAISQQPALLPLDCGLFGYCSIESPSEQQISYYDKGLAN